jgi:hypothetical protein
LDTGDRIEAGTKILPALIGSKAMGIQLPYLVRSLSLGDPKAPKIRSFKSLSTP